MAGRTLHVVSHSHWDREWYMPFELHRRRLVRLLDDLLDVIDRDPEFVSFHLDGQSIPLEDYLEIRPAARERLRAAGESGRITLGPWYVLQDEFLTSAEAQVRNLLYGTRTAAEFGPVLRVGYLADAFGHIGQMPAILAGFGIDNAVFGRGVNPWREDLPTDAPEAERGYRSEFIWRGSDGTEIFAIYMANWYSNAMDIPAEPEACVARFAAIRDACLKYATTSHLLLMNGCDHTPCQLNISELIRIGQAGLDDTIVHSRLDDYIAAVRAEAGPLQTVTGELRSQYTDGWGTLTNVLSTRLYLKQANYRCQLALESYLEPLEAVLALHGRPADRDFRRYLWKLLLQNHPHDSICGCSVDPVHREMETRFDKVEELAGQLGQEAHEALAARIDTTALGDDEVGIIVYNPLGFDRAEMVACDIDFPDGTDLTNVEIRDTEGKPVPCEVLVDRGRVWTYRLPDDRFRVPYHCHRVTVCFRAEAPAFGYALFRARPTRKRRKRAREVEGVMENEFLSVIVHHYGVFDIIDKATGHIYRGLNALLAEDDEGDEYNFRAPDALDPRTPEYSDEFDYFGEDLDEVYPLSVTRNALGDFHQTSLILDRFVYHELDDNEELEDEEDDDVVVSAERTRVHMLVALPRGARRVEVELAIVPEAGRQRLRALFPSVPGATTVAADGHFEVVTRRLEPWRGWRNPDYSQPSVAFVDVSDATGGLTIAHRGLPEYEVLRDEDRTIALTLLRSVGELGDWGDFPTPDAQCIGRPMRASYAIIPHEGPLRGSADLEARAFHTQLRVVQTDRHAGTLPSRASWIRLEPAWLVLSAVRWAEDRDAFIVRFYNPYDEPVDATLHVALPVREAHRCNLNEERGDSLGPVDGRLAIPVGPKQIVTLELA